MKSSEEKLYAITLKMAKENPEYWSLFKHYFEQQAALKILNHWRKHKDKEFKPKMDAYLFAYVNGKKLTKSSCPGVIVEYPGDKASQHADKIKAGLWLELEFADPNFAANLYKALRLKLISATELATGLSLFWARHEFGDSKTLIPAAISQHYFFETGPYQLEQISYITPEAIKIFKQKLSQLPKNQQCYFSLSFSEYRQFADLIFYLRKLLQVIIKNYQKNYNLF